MINDTEESWRGFLETVLNQNHYYMLNSTVSELRKICICIWALELAIKVASLILVYKSRKEKA